MKRKAITAIFVPVMLFGSVAYVFCFGYPTLEASLFILGLLAGMVIINEAH